MLACAKVHREEIFECFDEVCEDDPGAAVCLDTCDCFAGTLPEHIPSFCF